MLNSIIFTNDQGKEVASISSNNESRFSTQQIEDSYEQLVLNSLVHFVSSEIEVIEEIDTGVALSVDGFCYLSSVGEQFNY